MSNTENNKDWMKNLLRGEKSRLTGSVANVLHALRYAPDWQGVLKFNEFTLKAEIHQRPPFSDQYQWNGKPEDWVDTHDTQCMEWLNRWGIPAHADAVGRAVWVVANETPYHPVREYLDGLKWDGVKRLDNWLITYAGADTTAEDGDGDEDYAQKKLEYVQAVGSRWLMCL